MKLSIPALVISALVLSSSASFAGNPASVSDSPASLPPLTKVIVNKTIETPLLITRVDVEQTDTSPRTYTAYATVQYEGGCSQTPVSFSLSETPRQPLAFIYNFKPMDPPAGTSFVLIANYLELMGAPFFHCDAMSVVTERVPVAQFPTLPDAVIVNGVSSAGSL